MIERAAVWADLDVGVSLLSPTGNPLVVIRKERGWLLMHDHNKHKIRVSPKPPDKPVTILECTPEEAEVYARKELGAERILDFERERRMPERAKQWLVPPLATKGPAALSQARDHVGWYHGSYSGVAEGSGGFKTLKQILAAHAEMHDEVHMDLPHTHKEA